MDKITLETESYMIQGKSNERFFPFLELEFSEWVIYENDKPKYYFELHHDVKSEFRIINWIITELKNGSDLRKLVMDLGNQYKKNWDIIPSQVGLEVENSYQTERIELALLSDKIIDKIKTTTY